MNYSKYWSEEGAKKYGYDSYCQKLVKLVLKSKPKKVYDLACGTGYPFIKSLLKKGIKVYGSDVSPRLVYEARENYPKAKLKLGDYREIVEFSNAFDVSYCFRSSWYMEDLEKMIKELVRITKPGGRVIFDVLNPSATKKEAKQIVKEMIFFWRNGDLKTYSHKVEEIMLVIINMGLKCKLHRIENKVVFEIWK